MSTQESYSEDRIVVYSYFREGDKVVGTEVCSTELEARFFARHQLKYYPYVEIVYQRGIVQPWGVYDIKSSDVIARFK